MFPKVVVWWVLFTTVITAQQSPPPCEPSLDSSPTNSTSTSSTSAITFISVSTSSSSVSINSSTSGLDWSFSFLHFISFVQFTVRAGTLRTSIGFNTNSNRLDVFGICYSNFFHIRVINRIINHSSTVLSTSISMSNGSVSITTQFLPSPINFVVDIEWFGGV